MAKDKREEAFKSLRKRGLDSAFGREPSTQEIRAMMRKRPYLELRCPDPEQVVFTHDKRELSEVPNGWQLLDIHGTHLIISPGSKLYDEYPFELEASNEGETEAAMQGTFHAQAIAAVEYAISTAYNLDWPKVSIDGTPYMKRLAWVMCELTGLDNDYTPQPDDKRCYNNALRALEAFEAQAAPTPTPQGGDAGGRVEEVEE